MLLDDGTLELLYLDVIFELAGEGMHEPVIVYVGDRPTLTGRLRGTDRLLWPPPEGSTAKLRLRNGAGTLALDVAVTVDSAGSFAYAWPAALALALGAYSPSVQVTLPSGALRTFPCARAVLVEPAP